MTEQPNFAVLCINGKQYKVTSNDLIITDQINQKIGSIIKTTKILILGSNDKTFIGTPFLKGVEIHMCLIKHIKSKNNIFFIKRRRKNSITYKSNRPIYSMLKIIKINFIK